MNESEIEKILTDTQLFLRQELLLFGNTIYRDKRKTTIEPEINSETSITLLEKNALTKKQTSVSSETKKKELILKNSESIKESWQDATDLLDLNKQICTCVKCDLGKTRTKFVFGVGNPNADLLVIGEAPGADEDTQGEPFVGRAGQLLNKILEAVQFKREEVYIANILKCRPPNNRRPTSPEVEQCEPYLWKQVEMINPKIILCLGLTAAQTLLKTDESLTQLRTSVHNYRGVPVYVTYHPAALLRNPNWKRPTWEDMQHMRTDYDKLKNN